MVPHLIPKTKFYFEAAIDMVGLATGLSCDCVLSVDLNESYIELCNEYDLEGFRRANIDVICIALIVCRLL